MSSGTPQKPSFIFGYWRPWKENSNTFDSYLNYTKDVSLVKYPADAISKYLNEASGQQLIAINEVSRKIGLGMSVLSNQMSDGFRDIAIQLGTTNQQLSFLNHNLDIQVELQKINNVLLGNISELLRIPDREKERQHYIEMGLKFLSNANKDEDLFVDALEELLAAEKLRKQDYFVLHRIGMIYLYANKCINPLTALDYFKRAAKYASVESDPKAVILANVLTKADNSKSHTDTNTILLLAAQSYEKAAFAAYVVGDFTEAVSLGEKAKKYLPNAQNAFMLAKYQARAGQADDAAANLNEAIDMMPSLTMACFSDLDLINESKVLKLLDDKNESICNKIKGLIQQLSKTNSDEDKTFIKQLEDALTRNYEYKLDMIYRIKLKTDPQFQFERLKLVFALGKNPLGDLCIGDFEKMPNLLIIADSADSNKNIIDNIITSLLRKSSPEDIRFVMIGLQGGFSAYEDMPHLLTPVLTDPKMASAVLRGMVNEMGERYKLMAEKGTKSIDKYNQLFDEERSRDEDKETHRRLPFIVVIIDELADLMRVEGSREEYENYRRDLEEGEEYGEREYKEDLKSRIEEREESLDRLLQMGQAAGIYFLVATVKDNRNIISHLEWVQSMPVEKLFNKFQGKLSVQNQQYQLTFNGSTQLFQPAHMSDIDVKIAVLLLMIKHWDSLNLLTDARKNYVLRCHPGLVELVHSIGKGGDYDAIHKDKSIKEKAKEIEEYAKNHNLN